MNKKQFKNIMISVHGDLWDAFTENCKANYKSASGVVRELVAEWNQKCEDKKEIKKQERSKN